MSISEIDALSAPDFKPDEKLGDKIDVYIGVFFDGTNNNKYQVTIGKLFRWNEILQKHADKIKKTLNISEVNQSVITNKPRSFWEQKNIFSRSELEFLYFGYGDINNTGAERFDTTLEKKSRDTLSGLDIHQITAKPDSHEECNKLVEINDRVLNPKNSYQSINNHQGALSDEAIKGAPAQNSTYTNVAILESLYNIGNQSETQKYFSIYVEGSGADMQIVSGKDKAHIAGHGVVGLGKGTGPSGAVSKVRKAVIMTKNLIERFRPTTGQTRELNLHFDICGFSRGAACARMFCYAINADRDDSRKSYSKSEAIVKHEEDLKLITGSGQEFLKIEDDSKPFYIKSKEIRNLLIADTVASIGVLYDGDVASRANRALLNTVGGISKGSEWISNRLSNLLDRQGDKSTEVDKGTEDIDMWGKKPYHYSNVDDYGLWATKLAKNVIHICAIDEVRQNFALTDIESSLSDGVSQEIFIPGCHTDVGGGAAIGMEGEKIINKDSEKYLTGYRVDSVSEIKSSKYVYCINEENLKKIGWLNSDSEAIGPEMKTITGRSKIEKDETFYSSNKGKIVLYRHVYPGYSNIALHLFKDKCSGENVFNAVPASFSVPSDLTNFYDKIKSGTESSGRYFCYPKSPEEYCQLRRKYLHFSFNEQILSPADNLLVNPPEYASVRINDNIDSVKLTSRIIYVGDINKNNQERKHMFDYEKQNDIHVIYVPLREDTEK